MKKYIISSICILLSLMCHAQNKNSDALSVHISNKMKAALKLTDAQQQEIAKVNQQLQQQKQQVRLQYPSADSLAIKLQLVESTRDKLYKPILDKEQYQLYKKSKGELINNN